ncbi:hypothetical protein [uncultured Dokdonia sp.]|uniref:hypothetical protein n=1 Tax=uncultured Dokdonia sp. TaxID=575653 RepID=UPI00261FD4A8|nr:hypothetical protein [uncultured Dokdonia sp.]
MSCKSTVDINTYFKKIPQTNVSKDKIENAESFIKMYLETCSIENSEATFTNRFVTYNEKYGEILCKGINNRNGKIVTINFEELRGDGHSYLIYRFKVKFENIDKISEVRVSEKFTGEYETIIVRNEWSDILKSSNKF